MDGELTGAGIATAAILVITAIAKIVNEWRKDRHAEDKETHASSLAEFRELADQWAKAYEQSRQEVHALRDELNTEKLNVAVCRADLARAVERIGALEELLERHTDLKFRRWTPNDSASFEVRPEP